MLGSIGFYWVSPRLHHNGLRQSENCWGQFFYWRGGGFSSQVRCLVWFFVLIFRVKKAGFFWVILMFFICSLETAAGRKWTQLPDDAGADWISIFFASLSPRGVEGRAGRSWIGHCFVWWRESVFVLSFSSYDYFLLQKPFRRRQAHTPSRRRSLDDRLTFIESSVQPWLFRVYFCWNSCPPSSMSKTFVLRLGRTAPRRAQLHCFLKKKRRTKREEQRNGVAGRNFYSKNKHDSKIPQHSSQCNLLQGQKNMSVK